MSDEIVQEISKKLDQLILLVATGAIKGLKPTEAIVLLGQIGLDRNAIAQLVGTTPSTVSVRISEAKARHGSAKKKTARKG